MNLNSKFKDSTGHDRDVRLNVPIMLRFCRDNKLKLEMVAPCSMDSSQLIDLAYAGTRGTAREQAFNETPEEFYECLDGYALTEALEAAAGALVNFIHHIGSPQRKALLEMEHALRQAGHGEEEILRQALEKVAALGQPETSSSSAEPSA